MKNNSCMIKGGTNMNRQDFYDGKLFDAYRYMGAHKDGDKIRFVTYAPRASRISIIGEFNDWNEEFMEQDAQSGFFLFYSDKAKEGQMYKYCIYGPDGNRQEHCDPYGFEMELRPGACSIIRDITTYRFNDRSWMQMRSVGMEDAINIYEMHMGSWRMNKKDENGWYQYDEIAKMLVPYLKQNNYTHVELMPLSEHPFDGSWGYQVTGYYAPTSRYGTPEDFAWMINYLHRNGIGVIMDWVPAHFPKDEHGLGRFDGQPLYEHPDPRRGEHPHWGTYIFNYGKREVENFLIANGLFWLKEFHVDGLRVDAVASMLYLDYGKDDGEWLPNEKGGNENYDAINLFRHMNEQFEKQCPGTEIIAEESTAWAGVTSPVSMNGLGFLFKWNMGWMNDFLEYMKLDPYFRANNHGKLTFSMQYAYSENFIQVLSHDEVVHGKGSMIEKMPGEYEDKFANLRTAYGFMYGHPGKKLLFMGQEFAQFREWSEKRSLDWELLDYDMHQKMQAYVRELNKLYEKYDAMYVNDCEPIGFEWMSCDNANMSTVSFVRRGSSAKDQLLFICNFTPVQYEEYRTGVPCAGEYTKILSSDDEKFGGTGVNVKKVVKAEKIECEKKEYSIELNLPPMSVTVFKFDYK